MVDTGLEQALEFSLGQPQPFESLQEVLPSGLASDYWGIQTGGPETLGTNPTVVPDR
jgi:hypothetical protein